MSTIGNFYKKNPATESPSPWEMPAYIKKFKFPVCNEHGVALLITLTIITVMIAAGMEILREMDLAAETSATRRDRQAVYEMAVSGISGARAILVKDRMDTNSDSLQEDWANPEIIKEMTDTLSFDDGKLEVQIIDELGKIQINALVKFPQGRTFNAPQQQLWERFSSRLMMFYEDLESNEDTEPVAIIHSIKDWLDSGDDDAITGLSGAESSYYEDLEPPYQCKNAPFTHLGEVALVKGVTPEIFYGFGEILGLSNYITVHGVSEAEGNGFTYAGKININTAELPVIAALLPSDSEGFAQALIDHREEKSDEKYVNNLSNINWYKNVPGFGSITIDSSLITVTSDVFRIQSSAQRYDVKVTVTAVVQREQDKNTGKWHCKILNWHAQ